MHTTKVYGGSGIDNDLHHNATDPNFSVRRSAFHSLAGLYYNYGVVERFATQLPTERKSELRLGYVEELARRQDARAVRALCAVLDDDSDAVREVAARTLGELGDSDAIEPLRAALSDPVPAVRHAIINALAALRDIGTIATLLVSFDESVPEPDRIATVHAAGAWIEPTTTALLGGIVARDGSAAVRNLAQRVLDLHAKATDCAPETRPEWLPCCSTGPRRLGR
ncbi:HEAT repeat domain-containing protein [Nocardia sp. NPDC052316]|uniref:HEAT repeat domain-containing protein n=1 Tax=Nocardia sp. NPDC052316 TaxID=3364329 RepID=UPI0037C7E474